MLTHKPFTALAQIASAALTQVSAVVLASEVNALQLSGLVKELAAHNTKQL